jgi:hypothetical protein
MTPPHGRGAGGPACSQEGLYVYDHGLAISLEDLQPFAATAAALSRLGKLILGHAGGEVQTEAPRLGEVSSRLQPSWMDSLWEDTGTFQEVGCC